MKDSSVGPVGLLDPRRQVSMLDGLDQRCTTCSQQQEQLSRSHAEQRREEEKHLSSHRNAEFLHNEVPGMSIPHETRRRMELAGTGPAARAEGIKIAQETLAAIKHRVAGVYIMPPFNRVESALAVLEAAADRLAARSA